MGRRLVTFHLLDEPHGAKALLKGGEWLPVVHDAVDEVAMRGQGALVLQLVRAADKLGAGDDHGLRSIIRPDVGALRHVDVGADAAPMDFEAQDPRSRRPVRADDAGGAAAEAYQGVIAVLPAGEE